MRCYILNPYYYLPESSQAARISVSNYVQRTMCQHVIRFERIANFPIAQGMSFPSAFVSFVLFVVVKQRHFPAMAACWIEVGPSLFTPRRNAKKRKKRSPRRSRRTRRRESVCTVIKPPRDAGVQHLLKVRAQCPSRFSVSSVAGSFFGCGYAAPCNLCNPWTILNAHSREPVASPAYIKSLM